MAWRRAVLCAGGIALLTFAGTAFGQSAAATQAPPSTVDDALRAMSDAAGVIFTGVVTGVRRPQRPDGSAAGVVAVDFAVVQAIRGVSGRSYTLREWAGLWTANDQPFRAGQQYLMLLHTPNAAGLSSPVGGSDGAIPIRGAGPAALPDSESAAHARPEAEAGAGTFSIPQQIAQQDLGAAAVMTADLGWIATRVAVPLAYAKTPQTATPITVHASARGDSAGDAVDVVAAQNAGSAVAVAANRAVAYGSVIESLRRWEAERGAR